MLNIEIVSDVICPWCFIGKRRLEQAIGLFGSADEIRVRWLPFQLNPNMPPEGMDRREYRTAKFGSWERSLALDTQITDAGKQDGIAFNFTRAKRTPNTLDAHRLIWLADKRGVQDAVVEALFRGYFVEGNYLSDRGVLAGIASEAGLDRDEVDRLTHGDDGRSGVQAEEERAHRLGISGVPTFLVNGRIAFSGAQRPEKFLAAFRTASAGPSAEGEGAACSVDSGSGKPSC
jgi:predicted DsbA family dithiol-disulfide isomerase